MDYMPIFMRLKGRPCVVVGGGVVAARKVDLLARAGAAVTVVAPELGQRLAAEAARGRMTHCAEAFRPAHLDGAQLVIAATGDEATNRAVFDAAEARKLPVNVVDQPRLCRFITPAIVDRSPLMIAISTGGAAPVLARRIRSRMEALFPPAYARLAALADGFRERVGRAFQREDDRRRFWEAAMDGPAAQHALAGRETAARETLEQQLQTHAPAGPLGEVYLIGAGPGDPELMTLKALRLLQQADVVVYDRLAAEAIVDMARRDADKVFVGKCRRCHSHTQAEINALLIDEARKGKRVARLKGGDPFLFGRGGEEMAALAAAGVPYQAVPGVTAAAGCAAYAGIPLTHRDHAQTCVLVTGHPKNGELQLDWAALARPRQTVVFYMGLARVATITRELMAHGLPGATPAAAIEQGTTGRQRVVTAPLEDFAPRVKAQGIQAPAVLVIGEVAALHEQLAWFQGGAGDEPAPFHPVTLPEAV